MSSSSSSSLDNGKAASIVVTARSLSSPLLTPTNSAEDTKKTPPKIENKEHGGAGDNIERNFYHHTPTSRPGTTSSQRRRLNVIPRNLKDCGTPKAPPRHQLNGSGRAGPSSNMPKIKHNNLVVFDDIDVLLYSIKEMCDLVESERFVCGPTFMTQFKFLTQRLLFVIRNLSQRCLQNVYSSPPLVKSSLFDNLLRSPHLLNARLSRTSFEASLPHQEPFPSSSNERVLKRTKIMVPEHPNYNFIGRILGPRGISIRQLESSSGCGILIRGKGSVKNAEREERLRSRNAPGFEHLNEPLHILITAEGNDETECDAKLDKCKRRIEKLLKPEYDEYKRCQLAQLAMINGNFDATRGVSPAI